MELTSTNTVFGDCPKCKGTGRFITTRGVDFGKCFTCDGTGKKMTKVENKVLGLFFPKLMKLVIEKNVKLHLSGCKVIKTQAGKYYLVSPTFGLGIFGEFTPNGMLWAKKGFTQTMADQLQDIEANGLEAAKRISALTGACCACGRTLTRESSIEEGMGPICSGKF